MQENICSFIPFKNNINSIHIINFVLETKKQTYTTLKNESVYKMYYVYGGKGYIHTLGNKTLLQKGDIFFTFPAFAFSLESEEDFKYMYISFIGFRGNEILEKLKIKNNNFIFKDNSEVENLWIDAIKSNESVMDIMSESVLLHTFAVLGNKILPKKDLPKQYKCVSLIKKYIDDHFTNQDFSLEKMSKELSYNPKYVSHVFKKEFGVGIVEYLNTIRIQNACTLMEQGFSGVNDISYNCGYSDSQYFSKIFKSRVGVTPTEYFKNIEYYKLK